MVDGVVKKGIQGGNTMEQSYQIGDRVRFVRGYDPHDPIPESGDLWRPQVSPGTQGEITDVKEGYVIVEVSGEDTKHYYPLPTKPSESGSPIEKIVEE